MASLHKQHGKPNWFCAFTDSKGVRRFRSTKTANRKQAEEICNAWEKAAAIGKNGLLTADRARDIVNRTIADIYVSANAEDLPNSTIEAWGNQWLESKSLEISDSSNDAYQRTIKSFLGFLGTKAGRNLAALQSSEITRWRDSEAKRIAINSVNKMLKILRICLGDAQRQGIITNNPARLVRTLKQRGTTLQRRSFTIPEVKRLLEAADNEWKGIILFGLYTGQRMGDIVSLTWDQINTERNEVSMVTRKTGRRMLLPLVAALRDYIADLPTPNSSTAPLFPKAYEIYSSQNRVSSLSNQFYAILVGAGLVEKRSHHKAKDGKGRSGERTASQITFHSLRHSTVTLLKKAGVSDAQAQLIVGHESAEISQAYTHLDIEDARKALGKLPDLSEVEKQDTE